MDLKTKIFMKNTILIVICAVASFSANPGFSQVASTSPGSSSSKPAFVKESIKIEKFYSQKELDKMPKLDLIQIYKDRLAYLIEVLPFLSLHPVPGSTFHDMAIPETEDNIAHLEKEMTNKQNFTSSLFETLDDVLPYSEKDNLIWCILYFDDMIQKSVYTK
jgi:hypothetical protein